MRVRQETRTGRALMTVAGWILRTSIGLLGRTWRIRVGEGAEHLERAVAAGTPVVITLWHNRLVTCGPFLLRWVHRRGLLLSVLASASRDGELFVRTVEPWGAHIVRGSATRGGFKAIWGTYRALQRLGRSAVIVPDGPTGPAYRYKEGACHLARLSGAPLLPLGCAARRYWTLRSWDRLFIPRPFTRVVFTVGVPTTVHADADAEALEGVRGAQEATLNRLTSRAEALAGAPPLDGAPVPTPLSPPTPEGL